MNDLMSSLATTPDPTPMSPKTESFTQPQGQGNGNSILFGGDLGARLKAGKKEGGIDFDALLSSLTVKDGEEKADKCIVVPDPNADPSTLDPELMGPIKTTERCRNGARCTYAGYFGGCKFDHGPLCRNGANCTFDGFFGGCKFYHGPNGRIIDRQKQAFVDPSIEDMGEEQRGMLRIVEEKIRLVEEKFRKVERERAELERLRDMILSMKDGDVPTQIYAQVGEGGAGAQPTGSGATAAAGGMVNPYSTKPGGSQGDYTQAVYTPQTGYQPAAGSTSSDYSSSAYPPF
ncbi:hypothetical protein TL16_g06708 [Triparma laevis f. inornata]|uniref:Uncharacterized protein n=1 Tax=Triparma laevis f. inornata TaxID=1714386 RepID=A0A9W7APA6_9STRA|nr:hypothetical protein TL16_g06708 [Triparma laevis f. inornata]